MADSGRAVADSGRVVFFDIWGNGLLSIKNILAMLQSDKTIWAKLFGFAAGCIEECIDATQFNAHRPALCNLS